VRKAGARWLAFGQKESREPGGVRGGGDPTDRVGFPSPSLPSHALRVLASREERTTGPVRSGPVRAGGSARAGSEPEDGRPGPGPVLACAGLSGLTAGGLQQRAMGALWWLVGGAVHWCAAEHCATDDGCCRAAHLSAPPHTSLHHHTYGRTTHDSFLL
jgi:hypothetical protein